jgi:hypothetical protein
MATLINKPPLGIKPKRIWQMERVYDLVDCIQRRLSNTDIPWPDEHMVQYVTELQDLIMELHHNKKPSK